MEYLLFFVFCFNYSLPLLSPLSWGKAEAQISVGQNICSASVEVQEECEEKLVRACVSFCLFHLLLIMSLLEFIIIIEWLWIWNVWILRTVNKWHKVYLQFHMYTHITLVYKTFNQNQSVTLSRVSFHKLLIFFSLRLLTQSADWWCSHFFLQPSAWFFLKIASIQIFEPGFFFPHRHQHRCLNVRKIRCLFLRRSHSNITMMSWSQKLFLYV